MSIDPKRRLASAAFAALLLLSVLWPAPVVSLNDVCCHVHLTVDDLSFLGREAPSWDIVYWCLAGLVLIAILRSGTFDAAMLRREWKLALPQSGDWRRRTPKVLGFVVVAALATAAIWQWADQPITAYAEAIQSGATEGVIRLANRFGGGMNPAMIVLFYLIAGVVYRVRRWIHYAVAMAFAGAGAGLLVQLVKVTVGRTRPELWLGAFHHARASARSFPSGHTVGAFALAGVLVFAARS